MARVILGCLTVATLPGCGAAPSDSGGPIDAPKGEWTFVPFDEAVCGNGESTGIGINLASEPTDEVLIYFQGGGACANAENCFGLLPTSLGMWTGYGPAQFAVEPNLVGIFFLSRLDPRNPFRKANMVFVPYCTGDLHAGDAETSYDLVTGAKTAQHRGHRNVVRYLERLRETFPNASKVWVTGASAGGYGAAYNAWTIKESFPKARVGVVSDSGPLIELRTELRESWQKQWNLQLPPGCKDCAEHPELVLEYSQRRSPDMRWAFLSFESDPVLALYSGQSTKKVEESLADFRTRLDALPSARAFITPGAFHVVLVNTFAEADGAGLTDWLRDFVEERDGWRTRWAD